MDVIIKTKNDIVYVTIQGSIDSKTAGDLQAHITEKVTDSKKVIIDFSAVDFMSSAGLRVLLMLYRQLNTVGGKVLLAGISDDIRDVMSMTGFINYFEVFNSVEEAENQF